jgi:hypothetical protein
MADDLADDFDRFFAGGKSAADKAKADSYFTKDCQWIVGHAQASPDAFPGIAGMALLSIKQPFALMPVFMGDLARMGDQSSYLFGAKRAGFQYVREHKADLWASARAFKRGDLSLDELIADYMKVPSLGIVKASFVAQMTAGEGACIDTINQQRFGLPADFGRSSKHRPSSLPARIHAYNAYWQAHGDSAWWWDSWCDHMAERKFNAAGKRPTGNLNTGAEYSALHRLAITAGVV